MSRRFLPFVAALAVPIVFSACGTSPPPGGVVGPRSALNTAYCPAGGPTLSAGCSGYDICHVCVQTPPKAAKRTTDTKEFADKSGGPVDDSCLLDGAAPRVLGVSKKVKFKGHVKIFANGNDTSNVKIEIFAGLLGGALGASIGSTTTGVCTDPKDPTKCPAGGASVVTVVKDPGGGNPTYNQYELPYSIDGVPTETQLIVKTSSGATDAGWFPLYDYNIIALNSKLESDGTYAYDARALGNADYGSILRAAYAKSPDAGQSAIAGEVHDCGDVRITYATVGIGPSPGFGLFYLSSNEDNPLPDSGQTSTTRTGLYAAGGFAPGSYRVSASGLIDGKVVGLGSFDIMTFADSVSAFTFRGTTYPYAK